MIGFMSSLLWCNH